MQWESHNVCQKLFLYEQSVAFSSPPPPLYFTKFFDCAFQSACVLVCVCVGVRASVCALALPLIANGSSFIPPPTLPGPRNFCAWFVFCTFILQMPWVFHFPLLPQIKFSKLFAAKLSTHHSQSANWQRTERPRERHETVQKLAETNDNVDVEKERILQCLLNLQILC